MSSEFDIYDFDKTIYRRESGSAFLVFCALHYPWILPYLIVVLTAGLLLALRVIKLKKFKQICFYFVKFIPLQSAVEKFWDINEKYINEWFYERKRQSVIISASPDFLLEEISKRLGAEYLICTRYDKKSIAVIGENCRGEEKVFRFKKEFPNAEVIDVYSDSIKHDMPIFSLAQGSCFNVDGGRLKKFDFDKIYHGAEKYGK